MLTGFNPLNPKQNEQCETLSLFLLCWSAVLNLLRYKLIVIPIFCIQAIVKGYPKPWKTSSL